MGCHAGWAELLGTSCVKVAGEEAGRAQLAGVVTPSRKPPFHHRLLHCALYLGLSAR